MKHKAPLVILLLLTAGVYTSFAQGAPVLSPGAEVTVITADPGKELYASFGHTAFRITDPAANLDRIYNYGTFSFRQPNFYLKFIRGQLDYMLSGYPFSYFLGEYIRENRGVREMVLRLTLEQKQEIFNFLEWNRLPENAQYRYDFFFDNCATRVRDVVEKVLGSDLVFTDILDKPMSFRQAVEIYTAPSPWTGLGINVVLGSPTDKGLTTRTAMFLPDYLEKAFNRGTMKSTGLSLVQEVRVLNAKKDLGPEVKDFWDPTWILWGIFTLFLGFSVMEFLLKKRIFTVADNLLFLVLGLLGLLVAGLWFFTDHKVTYLNWNILWAMPTHVVLSFLIWKKNPGKILKTHWTVVTALAGALVIFWALLPQGLDPRFLPILLTIVIRGLFLRRTFF